MIVAGFLQDLRGFFSSLSEVSLLPLLIGALLFIGYLSLRALAFRNILQDAYPHTTVPYRQIWGAYVAAYGFNNVIPARGGDVLKVYLTRTSIPGSSYPTIGAALLVEAIFDLCAGGLAILVAISLGVFPHPPEWVSFDAVDLSFVVADGRRALFLVTALVVGLLVIFSLVALRVRTFWARVRQGFAVLQDRRRYFRRVWGVQGIGWLVRGAAFGCFLSAFGLPATPENVLLALSANAVAAIFPFTPGGAGVVQALLVKMLGGAAAASTIAAYGVGQQATIAVISLAVGFVALAWVFEIRSFRAVIERGRADRLAERESERAAARTAAEADISTAAGTAESSPADGSASEDATAPRRGRAAGTGPGAGHHDGDTKVQQAAPARPVNPDLVDDWLAEELAPDRAREQRRAERARWRRRR